MKENYKFTSSTSPVSSKQISPALERKITSAQFKEAYEQAEDSNRLEVIKSFLINSEDELDSGYSVSSPNEEILEMNSLSTTFINFKNYKNSITRNKEKCHFLRKIAQKLGIIKVSKKVKVLPNRRSGILVLPQKKRIHN